MSSISLGLDIGPTSIGWALIDEANSRFIDSGVRIFPEGVDRDQQGGEKSKNQTRRTARGMRRQLARRADRKRQLHQLLAEHGLIPADAEALDQTLALNPYELRARALDHKLPLHHLGRAFLHLNQRRGFQSNRKTDRGIEAKGMLAEIADLETEIEGAGWRTLGEFLFRKHANHQPTDEDPDSIVRTRHTRRDMYRNELETIWAAQAPHHPDLLTDQLLEAIREVIFFQRPMYWPKSVVGRCELEPKQKRCPRADRHGQRFRLLQEVNNLRMLDRDSGEDRVLTEDERATLIDYLAAGKERTFDQIRKKLGLADAVQFNFERAKRNKLKGHETDAMLASNKGLGKRWAGIPGDARDRIVDILIHETDEDAALTNGCGLTPDEADRASALHLPDGYYNFSRDAIDRLLPHLERGLLLMADDASNSALHAAGYLRPDEREVKLYDLLPPAPDLTNPIVRQAMVEVRKVVNNVIREYGCPDGIHVELARDAKKSLAQREEIRFENAKRRRFREECAAIAEEHGVKPTRATINRIVLWREQEDFCPYCGQKISITQLLRSEADVDHILPRWRSLDDSLANKVVCHRLCNAAKGDQTPREWLEDSDPERYQRCLQVAERLSYGKQQKFRQKDIVLDDFVQRQLRDTTYISRCVAQYLKCLGARVTCPRGNMTADLRHYWGMNNILDPEGRGRKMRNDHRHHAIDAIVLALIDDKRLHALANSRGENVAPPWANFLSDARQKIRGIEVSHRVLRRLRGALHEDTIYGPTQEPNVYVRRKPVTAIINVKHLAKVRDDAIREILKEHLRARGVDPDASGGGAIPADTFKGDNTPRMPSGVAIKRVRMLEESETFQPVSSRRPGQYVKPGSNHHIVYHAVGKVDEEQWTAEVVTMWDAAVRTRRGGLPAVNTADTEAGRFVMSLSIGESFLMIDDGSPQLCVVRKLDQRSKRLFYKLHTDAREAGEINKDNLYLTPKTMRARNARKVTVDPLGRIRWAND